LVSAIGGKAGVQEGWDGAKARGMKCDGAGCGELERPAGCGEVGLETEFVKESNHCKFGGGEKTISKGREILALQRGSILKKLSYQQRGPGKIRTVGRIEKRGRQMAGPRNGEKGGVGYASIERARKKGRRQKKLQVHLYRMKARGRRIRLCPVGLVATDAKTSLARRKKSRRGQYVRRRRRQRIRCRGRGGA